MGTGSFYTGQGNTLNITSRYLADVTSTYPPPVDAVNDDLNSALSLGPSCEISGTQLSCMFSRPISVPASNDQVLSLDGEAYVMWAVGDVSGTGGISKHSDMAKTADTYAMWNISSAAVPTATSNNLLYQIHAILMIVAWMWLLPFGIFVSRFRDVVGMGKVGEGVPLWWRIHQPNQYIGCILFLVSLGIIFARVNQSWFDGYLANSTTKGSHQILGILACVLAILQPILATCRNGVNEKDDDRRRRCHDSWHVLHSICGYLAFLCALAAVALGIQEYNSTLDWPLVYKIGYGISVGAIIVFALVGIILAVVRQKQKSITVEGDYLVGEVLKPAQPKAIAVPALAWIFFVMLLAGATLCCVSVAMNPTRTLSEEL